MPLTRAALLLSAALVSAPLAAQTRPAPAATPAATPVVQPLQFTERTLANGLRVYAMRDTTTPNVSVQVWYDVGSKDDPKDRSGFAHLFEHLMFKETRNIRAEQFDRLTEDVGGYNNASTNDDYTNYYEVVPANHLERILFAEADRMSGLVIDPKNFASERDVVKEELRSRVLAQPYGKLFYLYFPMISYDRHPYARPGIGSIENLDAATVDDVRAFHATYYRPDNAVLVVSGNFDPARLDQWIDQYFAPIAKPNRAIPRVTVQEPPRTKATTRTVYEPNVPLPAVLMSYKLPADNHPDNPALSVLNGILSSGENSRLYRSLVYRDQVAQSADTFLDTKQATGSFAVLAIAAGGKKVEDAEAGLQREIAALRDQPVSDAELSEAKNEIITQSLRSRQTAEGRASTLAGSVIVDGDPRAADRQLAELATVTAADVQRVARLYLKPEQAATVRYMPQQAAPAGAAPATITVAATVQATPLATPAGITVTEPAPDGVRKPLPAPAAPVAARLPQPVETKLDNGMRVIVVEKHDVPLTTALLVADAGAARDPSGKAGVGSLSADLLTKGTATRSATQIASAVESLGGAIGSGANWDSASVSLTVKSDQLGAAMPILADVARNPAFAAEELERARAQAIDGANLSLSDPSSLAGMVATELVYGKAPYGHTLGGTPATLKAATREDVVAAYRAGWHPERSALILVGDVTQADGVALARKLFADWRPAGDAAPKLTASQPPAPKVVVVDMPGAGQAGVVIARPGIARKDAVYTAAEVANAVLGSGYSSRLNQEIRIKRGLAYGAGSGLSARRLPGSISASTSTKNESADEVVAIIRAEMARLAAAPVPAAELDSRKAVLVGRFGRAAETTGGIAGIVGDYVVQDVPLTELARYTPSVEGVSAAAVQEAAKLFDPKAASIVVVGEANAFVDDLRKVYPDLTVVPVAELTLDGKPVK